MLLILFILDGSLNKDIVLFNTKVNYLRINSKIYDNKASKGCCVSMLLLLNWIIKYFTFQIISLENIFSKKVFKVLQLRGRFVK